MDPTPQVSRRIEVRRLGRTDYAATHRLQEDLVDRRAQGEIGDQLLLTEHDAVITLGRRSREDPASFGGVPVVSVERGGEATYHGPGQLVVYPIVQLDERLGQGAGGRDLHRYLRDLEQVVIGVLGEFQLRGERRDGASGVWIGDKKICSVGVAVRRWVAWHGFALNLRTDLDVFQSFRPCGLDPNVMTRLCDHVELPPGNLLAEVLVVKHFQAVFGHELPPPAG